jgi:hypothetical protein
MNPALQAYFDQTLENHELFRKAVADLEPEALAWRPASETSSIAVLVVHTLGSELEVLRCVRGLPSDRDRDAEFVDRAVTAADLLTRLDQADAAVQELVPQMTDADLTSLRERPNRAPQLGWYWLTRNLGHEREHLGHVDLTKQLYLHRHAG